MKFHGKFIESHHTLFLDPVLSVELLLVLGANAEIGGETVVVGEMSVVALARLVVSIAKGSRLFSMG